MFLPDILRVTPTTSDVVTGMSVTLFLAVGDIAKRGGEGEGEG